MALALAAVLFFAPLVPDVRLSRPKLLLLETGLYGLLFAGLAARIYIGKLEIRNSLLLLPLLCYGLLEQLFYFLSPDKIVAVTELKRSLLSLAAYFVAANLIDTEKNRLAVLWAALAGSFLAALYGVLQHSGGIGILDVPHMDRVMSTFGNPIFFAANLVVMLPAAAGLLIASQKRLPKFLLIIFMATAVAALYFTQTRAAYIGLAAAAAVFTVLSMRSNRAKILTLVAIAALFAVFVALTTNIWMRQQQHLLIWRDTLVMWAHYPFAGTGPGTFHIYFPKFASDALRAVWPQGQFIVNDAHNEYIQSLAETGIAGFGIFLWLIIAFGVNTVRTLSRHEGRGRFVIIGLAASCAGLLAQNFFSVDMRFIVSAVYLYICMGLVDSYQEQRIGFGNLPRAGRFAGVALVLCAGAFTFHEVLKPYVAQKTVAAEKNFFDERVLEPAKTIDDLTKLLAQYPDEPLIHEKLGWVYSKERNWPAAIANYTKAAELNPASSGPLNNLGNIHFLTGNRQMAIEFWRRSLERNPDQVDSRLNLATAYYYEGRLKEAVDELKAALARDPGNKKALVMLKQMTE